jgi:hypothetical protein
VKAFQTELAGGKTVAAEGWAAIDGLYDAAAKLSETQFAEQLEIASMYRQACATPAGATMLADLMRAFLLQRVVRPGDDQFAVGIRQGQQDVVRRILSMIEFANTGGGRITGQPNQE